MISEALDRTIEELGDYDQRLRNVDHAALELQLRSDETTPSLCYDC
jgi:hypothetical protein